MDEMGRRWRIKLQHANRERERAEIEVQESRKAMGEMRERTDQAVAAHEAAAAKAAAERDAAESKAQQLALDLEWKTYAAEQVEEVMRGQEKRLGDAETLNRSLLLRCKGVEGLATELQKELTVLNHTHARLSPVLMLQSAARCIWPRMELRRRRAENLLRVASVGAARFGCARG